jgi:predicted permease
MEKLLQDLKFGAKLLWKEKALSLTVLLTLAVCVGANTTIFSVVNTVLLDPLPFPQPERLVRVFNSYPNAGAERASTSAPDYFYRRERVQAFAEVAVYQNWGHTVGEPGSPEQVLSMRVTPSFFPMLGVRPLLGRNFAEEEMDIGNEQVAILDYGFWRERYGGNPNVLGQSLRINGVPYTIVGVLPAGFDFLGQRDSRFFVPIPFTPEQRTPAALHSNNYEMIARLAPGATIDQAVAQIDALDQELTELVPVANFAQMLADAGYNVRVPNLQDDLLRDVRPTFIMLWVGVAFVLLIGCLNITNLMLTRSNVRLRELATRIAVGADRKRLGRQLLTEAVLIAVLGGLLGLGAGAGGLRLLETLGVEDLPRGAQVGIDGTVVAFTLAIAVGAGILFGLIPLIHIFRSDLNSVFRSESRTGSASRSAVVLRSALVTGQVAVAFILLIGAGLMFASLRAALSESPGFQPSSVLTGYVSLPDSRYPERADRVQFIDELLREARALPGVTAASVTSQIPFGDNNSNSVILPEGYVPSAGESLLSPFSNVVGPHYFETMRIPLVAGRFFAETDIGETLNVIIIDEWLANRYFPDESPLGRRMLWGRERACRRLLLPLQAAPVRFRDPGGQDGAGADDDDEHDPPDGGRYRPRSTFLQSPDDGGAHRRIAGDTPDAHVAARDLRRRGAVPSRRRYLRRAGLHGHPADARNGDSHRDRKQPEPTVRAGGLTRPPGTWPRTRARRPGRRTPGSPHSGSAVRRPAHRPSRAGCRRRNLGDGRRRGLSVARAARDAYRSGGGVKQRVAVSAHMGGSCVIAVYHAIRGLSQKSG